MTLRSTQPLTEMSTRSISWGEGGKGGWCVRLTTYDHPVPKSGNLNFLEPSRPVRACIGTYLPYIYRLSLKRETKNYTHISVIVVNFSI